jgi:hypothetical protein
LVQRFLFVGYFFYGRVNPLPSVGAQRRIGRQTLIN